MSHLLVSYNNHKYNVYLKMIKQSINGNLYYTNFEILCWNLCLLNIDIIFN